MSNEEQAKVVGEVIKRYGPIIDLRANPLVIIEILQTHGAKVEAHPTMRSIGRDGSTLPDILDTIAKLSQTVDALAQNFKKINRD
jgi:hypothetical protein